RTVSSSKYPIAVARLGRLDAKQTPHHGGVRDRGASGAWLARRRARATTGMDDLRSEAGGHGSDQAHGGALRYGGHLRGDPPHRRRCENESVAPQRSATGIPAGTVIVVLLDPRNRRELFRGRADMPLQSDAARRRTQIRDAIAL